MKDRGRIYLSENAQDLEKILKEGGLLISNHTNTDMDWYWALELLYALGFSPANLKWFVKTVVFKIPLFGPFTRLVGHIALSRDWNNDRLKMPAAIHDTIAIWPKPHVFALFPEGTRVTQAKMKLSKKFAEERGLKELNNCLQPRVKGFVLAVDVCRKSGLQYLFNCTTVMVPKPCNMLDLSLGNYHESQIYIEIIKLSDLPEGEEALAAWLRSTWVEKDCLIDKFHKNGIEGERVLHFYNAYAPICVIHSTTIVLVFVIVSRWSFWFAICWSSMQIVCIVYLMIRAILEPKVKLN